MERAVFKRSMAAMAVMAGSFVLAGCSEDSDEFKPSNQTEINTTELSDVQTGAENITFTSIGKILRRPDDQAEIYHGEYDLDGNHYDCTIVISDGGNSGGSGIDCEVTPIQQEPGGK